MPYADNNVYNIVLSSLNKIAGSTNADATYYYDWTVIPKRGALRVLAEPI